MRLAMVCSNSINRLSCARIWLIGRFVAVVLSVWIAVVSSDIRSVMKPFSEYWVWIFSVIFNILFLFEVSNGNE